MCRCGGYGFYTETLADGTNVGRVCDHISITDYVLKQDMSEMSPFTRSHNEETTRALEDRNE